jgi:HTH-type transcriptional regulator/antitoxin HipB
MRIRTRKDLGLLLRDFRIKRNMTQAQLAERVGVNRRWVGQVERGKTSPDLRTVLRALRALEAEMLVRPRRVSPAESEIAAIVDSGKRGRT